MKTKTNSLIGGLILMLLGGLALAFEMGYLRELSTTAWTLFFAASSALFFAVYFINGIRKWGWLIPAFSCAAVSGTILLSRTTIAGEWIATLLVGAVTVPFLVGYLLDRSRWGLLIPTFILAFVALIPPISMILAGEWMGTFIVGMLGLPFLVVYLAAPKAFWAIFPAGILLSIAAMIGLSGVRLGFDAETFAVSAMFFGWALTFGLAWMRRKQHSAGWAKYPAIAAAVLACLMLLITAGLQAYWSLALIITGLVIILLNLRPRREKIGVSS